MLICFGCEANGILLPRSRIELMPSALGARNLAEHFIKYEKHPPKKIIIIIKRKKEKHPPKSSEGNLKKIFKLEKTW